MRQDIISKETMTELTDDGRQLVISHMPLAYAMAWRLKDCGVSLEDLRQEGFLGLCEAALRYEETADCNFATYARHWCRKMMYMAIRRRQTAGDVQDNTFREEADDEDLLRMGQRQRIDDSLQCLRQEEQQVITLFYGLDTERQNLTEIAASLGVSRSRASAIHLQALQKLEEALTECPLVDYIDQSIL